MEPKAEGAIHAGNHRPGDEQLRLLEFLDDVIDSSGKTRRLAALLLIACTALGAVFWAAPSAYWLWVALTAVGINGAARTHRRRVSRPSVVRTTSPQSCHCTSSDRR
jgi:hypothetical protein